MKKLLLALMITCSTAAADTTVILEDGTVIETNKNVYISEDKLYKFEEAHPVSGSLVEPEEKGSEAWCLWYETVNNGTIVPSFEENYYIYTQNCR